MEGRGKTWPLLAAGLLFCAALLSGCGRVEPPQEVERASVAVSQEGAVTAWLVEDFAQDYYQVSELQRMVDEDLSSFNAQHQAQGFRAEAASVQRTKDGSKVVVELTFNDTRAYEAYTGLALFYGTLEQAYAMGYSLDVGWTAVKDLSSTAATAVLEKTKRHVMIVEGPVRSYAPYKPLYVSQGAVPASDGGVDPMGADALTYLIFQ